MPWRWRHWSLCNVQYRHDDSTPTLCRNPDLRRCNRMNAHAPRRMAAYVTMPVQRFASFQLLARPMIQVETPSTNQLLDFQAAMVSPPRIGAAIARLRRSPWHGIRQNAGYNPRQTAYVCFSIVSTPESGCGCRRGGPASSCTANTNWTCIAAPLRTPARTSGCRTPAFASR